jgi:hypothetical protein
MLDASDPACHLAQLTFASPHKLWRVGIGLIAASVLLGALETLRSGFGRLRARSSIHQADEALTAER